MRRKDCKAYLFLLPVLIVALLFSFLPLAKSFIGSFLTISQGGKVLGFAGFRNYASLLGNRAFLSSIGNTLLFVLLFLPANTFLTLLAAALTRKKRKWVAAAEFIFIAPLAFSLSAMALILKEIFRGKVSIINRITGLSLSWLDQPGSAMAVLVILGVFLDFALDYILLLTAFRSTDRSIIEAAEIDGANKWQTFWKVVLPQLKPTILIILVIRITDAARVYDLVYILTGGGPGGSTEVVSTYIYKEIFVFLRFGEGAAASLVITLVILAVSTLLNKVLSSEEV